MSRRLQSVPDVDVAIVGGSIVGATLAGLLARAGLRVAIIEQAPPSQYNAEADYELRVLALTRATERILRAVGAWSQIEKGRLGHFRHMVVWDANGSGEIRFDSAQICEPTMGYIAELGLLQSALEKTLEAWPVVQWHRPAALESMRPLDGQVEIMLSTGRRITARLLVGADGANSRVRDLAGIKEQTHDYAQRAIVCSVRTEKPHEDTAWQRFLSTGPLAFLPLADPHVCSIVWSTSPDQAQALLDMDESTFHSELQQSFDHRLGAVIETSRRLSFPLTRAHADNYVQPRLALVGDAAHRIHPLAGQGANLGFLDAATLAEVIAEAHAAGKDIGSFKVLRRYERWRKGDNLAMMLTMDGFKHLFGSTLPPVRFLRNFGLSLTDAVTPVKNEIMRRAMGLAGDLPRVAQYSA